MNRSFLAGTALVLVVFVGSAQADDPEQGFVSMFNGKDLTGWEGKPGGWWVEDGASHVAKHDRESLRQASLPVWQGGEPADFILRFSYKLVGGNSGVQIRSQTRPNWDTWGYQADMEAGKQWTGCLFQHDRGGVVMRGNKAVIAPDGTRTEEAFASGEELQKQIKQDDWNDYEIVAQGSKVAIKINGHLMCEVDDRDENLACHKGIIALQMHPGPPMEVRFRDLRIKVLD